MAELYGVLDTGFVRQRLPEIEAAIIADLTFRLGAPVETDPNSVFGALIATFSEREAALWELAQAVYESMYPPSASGVSLDNAVSFAGVTRLRAASSQVYAALYGTEGSLVLAGSQARLTDSQTLFDLAADTTITASAVVDARVGGITVVNNTVYTITINGAAYGYLSDASATVTEIVAGLALTTAPSGLLISTDGASVRFLSDGRTPFSIVVGARLALVSIGTPGLFIADEAGEVEVPIGALSQIVSQQTGWASVYNLQPGSLGRLDENDADLRARYGTGVYQLGAATFPAIRAGLIDGVVGVTAVTLIENTTSATVGSLPPHSVQAVVTGGDDLAIATALFNLVAAGIDTYGTTSIAVTDSQGTSHTIRFSRPQPVYIWVKVVTSLLSEETFPVNGLVLIAQAIVGYGNTLPSGLDVVLQRFYGPVYETVSGLAGLTVTMAATTSSVTVPLAGAYSATNIVITPVQQAVFDLSRVAVT